MSVAPKLFRQRATSKSSEKLAEAARIMNEAPGAMTLRYLQTLVEIGVEQNTTTIFPIPIDIISEYMNIRRGSNESDGISSKIEPPAADDAA